MARTLIEIVTAAIDEIGHHEVPTTIIGNSNSTAKKSRAIMQTAGEVIARAHPWQVLQKEHTYTMVAGQEGYDPPSDIRADWARLAGTSWDRANEWPMYEPLTPRQWHALKSGVVQTAVHRWGRIRGDQMLIWPAPTVTEDGHTLVYEYISRNWISSGGAFVDRWATDADTPVIDDFLLHLEFKWRFLASSRLPHQSEYEDAAAQIDIAKARDGGAPRVNLALSRDNHETPLISLENVPETGFGAL